MSVVTGWLRDFGLASLDQSSPTIEFIPSGPAVRSPDNLFATRAVSVTPDQYGQFSVDLVSTDDLRPAAWYSVHITWLDAAAGMPDVDFIDWKLFVPLGGGTIADLFEAPSNPAHVWVSPPDPANPVMPLGLASPTPGTWWLNTDTDDIKEWTN